MFLETHRLESEAGYVFRVLAQQCAMYNRRQKKYKIIRTAHKVSSLQLGLIIGDVYTTTAKSFTLCAPPRVYRRFRYNSRLHIHSMR